MFFVIQKSLTHYNSLSRFSFKTNDDFDVLCYNEYIKKFTHKSIKSRTFLTNGTTRWRYSMNKSRVIKWIAVLWTTRHMNCQHSCLDTCIKDNIVSLQRDLKVLYPTPTHAYLVLRECLSADLFLWCLLLISVFGFTYVCESVWLKPALHWRQYCIISSLLQSCIT